MQAEIIKQAIAGSEPIKITLGDTGVFESEDHDVVIIEVLGNGLHHLRSKVADAVENTQTHPDYKPHITIAYVKKGLGHKYALKLNKLKGREVTLDTLIFSDTDRNHTEIPLGNNSQYAEKRIDPNIYYHGSPSGDLRGASWGLHIGTHQAAHEALTARIGYPVHGSWDGSREYGKTLLAGQKTLKERGIFPTGHNVHAPEHDYYPHQHKEGFPSYGGRHDGSKVTPEHKPTMLRVRIKGEMTNTHKTAHPDFKANGYMKAAIKKGNAKRGYYYKNDAEDAGSVSAVVPHHSHLEILDNSQHSEEDDLHTKSWDELNRHDIDHLDKHAFGHKDGEQISLHHSKLNVIYHADLENAQHQMKNSGKSPKEWAKSVKQHEPIEVGVTRHGQYHIEDGHHRYLAAKILNKPLNVIVNIKGKPIAEIYRKAKEAGKQIHPEGEKWLNEHKEYLSQHSESTSSYHKIRGHQVEVLHNPNLREAQQLLQKSGRTQANVKEVRHIHYGGNHYMWDASEATHDDIHRALKAPNENVYHDIHHSVEHLQDHFHGDRSKPSDRGIHYKDYRQSFLQFEAIQFHEDEPLQFTSDAVDFNPHRLLAPPGGVSVHGVRYQQGQHIPHQVVNALHDTEKSKLVAGTIARHLKANPSLAKRDEHGSEKPQGSGDRTTRQATPGAVPGQGGVSIGTGQLGAQGSPTAQHSPLEGLPRRVKIPGQGEIQAGPSHHIRGVAHKYMEQAGLPYNPPKRYAKVDPERAKRIAAEYHNMKHDPHHPDVKAAYSALAKETLAQWEAIKKHGGLKVSFIPHGAPDPYAKSPRLATEDIHHNNHIWVYPTDSSFGSSEADVSHNPLLEETNEVISGKRARLNDIFRIVHDYFGHAKEGVGFRADGEENAWRMHSAMYSPLARKAMTSETRGQNSWVNFGPHAENNQKASSEKTVFADQKTGLLPDWVHTEGHHDHDISQHSEEYVENFIDGGIPFNGGTFQLAEYMLPYAVSKEYGKHFETGKPVEFTYAHNPQKSPNMGERFQQHIEPAGRYMVHANDSHRMEHLNYGTAKFNNPLVLHHNVENGISYDHNSWKAHLQNKYKAKGKKLSAKLAAAGHDGIVTVDHHGNTGEIVDLSSFHQSQHVEYMELGHKKFPIHKNVSLSTAHNLRESAKVGSLRGLKTKAGDYYLWDAYHATHEPVSTKLGHDWHEILDHGERLHFANAKDLDDNWHKLTSGHQSQHAEKVFIKRAYGPDTEVLTHKNLGHDDLQAFVKNSEYGSVRGVTDHATGHTYYWDASHAIHSNMIHALGLGASRSEHYLDSAKDVKKHLADKKNGNRFSEELTDLHHHIAKRFRIPPETARDILHTPVEQLKERDKFHARSNQHKEPLDFPKHPIHSAKIDHFQSNHKEAYVDYLKEHDPHHIHPTEHEEGIKHHPSYHAYVKWAKEGHQPPYTQTFETASGRINTSNRRRTLAAREAGSKTITAWHGTHNHETGNLLKYGDILKAAEEYHSGKASQHAEEHEHDEHNLPIGSVHKYGGVLEEVPLKHIQGLTGNTTYPEVVKKYIQKGYKQLPQLYRNPKRGLFVDDGHHRLKAAKEQGKTHVKVWIRPDTFGNYDKANVEQLSEHEHDELLPQWLDSTLLSQINDSQFRLATLKKSDKGLTELALIAQEELAKLKDVLHRSLVLTGYQGALAGFHEVAVQIDNLPEEHKQSLMGLIPSPSVAIPPTPPQRPLQPLGGEVPPEIRLPELEAAIAKLSSSPAMVGHDYQETAELVKAGAFAITADIEQRQAQEIKELLSDAMAAGQSRDEFIEAVTDKVFNNGDATLNYAHLENIFRTNALSQKSDAQLKSLSRPLVKSAFPYARQSVTHDERIRKGHKAIEHMGLDDTNIYNMDDPFFLKYRGPFYYQCRCRFTGTTVEQAFREGVLEAVQWKERAEAMAEKEGGSYYQYLEQTKPQVFKFVEHDDFTEPSFRE